MFIAEKDLSHQFTVAENLAAIQKLIEDKILRCVYMLNLSNSFFHCSEYKGAYKISFHGAKLLETTIGITKLKESPENLDLYRRLVYMKGVSCLVGDFIEEERQRYEKAQKYFMSCYKIVSENFENAETELIKINKMIAKCSSKIKNCLKQTKSGSKYEESPQKAGQNNGNVRKSQNKFKIRMSRENSRSRLSRDTKLTSGSKRGRSNRKSKSSMVMRNNQAMSVAVTVKAPKTGEKKGGYKNRGISRKSSAISLKRKKKSNKRHRSDLSEDKLRSMGKGTVFQNDRKKTEFNTPGQNSDTNSMAVSALNSDMDNHLRFKTKTQDPSNLTSGNGNSFKIRNRIPSNNSKNSNKKNLSIRMSLKSSDVNIETNA